MGMLIEYPAKLPAPLSGRISPTERRFISEVPGRPNYRTRQRDYHGTKDIDFIFTPDEAETFRYWWAKWLARGAGWFVADWPLLPQRLRNVYRFTKPPQWALEGGGIKGKGYWRVSATVEIRGRGMLPELPVDSQTSKVYPIEALDDLGAAFTDARGPAFIGYMEDMNAAFDALSATGTYIIYSSYAMEPENMNAAFDALSATGTYIIYSSYAMEPENMNAAFDALSAVMIVKLITYSNYEPEYMDVAFESISAT